MSLDRTEKATPKRREDARRKGQIARRPELGAIVGFLAALVMLRATGAEVAANAANLFVVTAQQLQTGSSLTAPAVHNMLIEATASLVTLSLPIVLAALVGGVTSNFAQGGLTFAIAALTPRANRFNPVANFKQAYSLNSIVELVKAFLKLGGIALACYGVFQSAITDAPSLIGVPAPEAFAAVGALFYGLAWRAGFVLLLVAAADYGWGWYQHEKSLRMTKQEVRDEYRQQEGDPMVKGQRRRQARSLVQRNLSADVARADVVVTNPTHFAVALRYDREKDAAPIVVAKGADFVAKKIRELAKNKKINVVENPPLARALHRTVDVGRTVPPELFRAVAELLAYVYRVRERG